MRDIIVEIGHKAVLLSIQHDTYTEAYQGKYLGELIRCKDCKYYNMETTETCSWCRRFGLKGLPEDAYCFKAESEEE